jgi:site-specific recombinase XerD
VERPADQPAADRQDWADLSGEAGLPHHKVRAAQHTGATLMLEAGVALAVAQEMLGHSGIR